MRFNDREILITTYSTENFWLKELPDQNWLCVLVVDNTPRHYIEEVLPELLLKNVCWLCTVGRESELAHDLMDEEIAYRQVKIPQPYLLKHFVITTWHDNFDEGI